MRRNNHPVQPYAQFNRRLQSLLGKVAQELGKSAELRVNGAFSEASSQSLFPEWLYDFERHETLSEEDRRGIDFTFSTDVGSIFIQIKSSERNARRFLAQSRKTHISVVVVSVTHTNMDIYRKVLSAIATERERILSARLAAR